MQPTQALSNDGTDASSLKRLCHYILTSWQMLQKLSIYWKFVISLSKCEPHIRISIEEIMAIQVEIESWKFSLMSKQIIIHIDNNKVFEFEQWFSIAEHGMKSIWKIVFGLAFNGIKIKSIRIFSCINSLFHFSSSVIIQNWLVIVFILSFFCLAEKIISEHIWFFDLICFMLFILFIAYENSRDIYKTEPKLHEILCID